MPILNMTVGQGNRPEMRLVPTAAITGRFRAGQTIALFGKLSRAVDAQHEDDSAAV